jgi:cathepsin C
MEKLIMVKYGELSTKKANINLFLKQLKDNVNFALKDMDVHIQFDKGRMFVNLTKDNFDEVLEKLKNVFGIHEYTIAYKLEDRDFDVIGNTVLELVKEKEFKTFKVFTKRSDKKYPIDSMEFSRKIGAVILKGLGTVSVDVHNPDLLVNVEIRNNAVYIYFNSEKGVFFIFMRYDKTTNNIENREYNWNSYCYSTLIGWYHIGDNHWGCFYGNKLNVNTNRTTISNYANLNKYRFMQTQTYSQEILSFSSQFKSQTSFVAMINSKKLSWKAKVYKALNDKTLFQINSLLKNKSLFLGNLNEIKPKPHKYIIQDIIKGLGLQYNVNSYKKLNNIVLTEKLPKHFNWLNYLSEPKEQGDCGSCYAMSLVSSLEARFRIKYENELKQYAHIFGDDLEKFELSTQHVIKCSYYNQGCDGGFSFSVGKFFKENEIYLKECFDNQQTTCVQQCKTNELNEINNRLGVNDYYYIGGAYGKANETNIMNDLYINGPLVISLEPEPSFASYSNGIYTGFANKYKRQNNESQFQKVSHSVLLVGWGEEEINNTTMKYWVIQNSWGTIWGKHGFAKILRGYNLGNIESIGEAAIPHFK